MVYGCGNNCIKYLVIFFNVLVTLVGIAILATSLALAFSSTFKQYFVDIIDQASPGGTAGSTFSTLQAIFYVTAAIGGLIFLTGFLGCCGAACESTCLLGFFFTIVLILFLTELGIGIAALAMQSGFQTSINTYYTNTVIKQYNTDCDAGQNTSLVNSWWNLEVALKCCGCMSADDYKTVQPAYNVNPPKGTTQCPAASPPCPANTKNNPCCTQLWSDLQSNVAIVGGVAIGLLVVELLAMIFSCCLCSAIRKRYQHYS